MVGVDTMQAAVRLVEHYFTAHALRVFDELGGSGVIPEAHALLRWIRRTQSQRFTKSEAQQKNRSAFSEAREIEPILALLVEHQYLRVLPPVPNDNESRGGRPRSPEYLVNPRLHEPAKQAPQVVPEQWRTRVA